MDHIEDMDIKGINKIDDDSKSFDCNSEKEMSFTGSQPEKKNININKTVKPGKKVKRGIIYLSTIPKFMNVTMIRQIFLNYGQLGRVYLQLDENGMFWMFFTFIFFL